MGYQGLVSAKRAARARKNLADGNIFPGQKQSMPRFWAQNPWTFPPVRQKEAQPDGNTLQKLFYQLFTYLSG